MSESFQNVITQIGVDKNTDVGTVSVFDIGGSSVAIASATDPINNIFDEHIDLVVSYGNDFVNLRDSVLYDIVEKVISIEIRDYNRLLILELALEGEEVTEEDNGLSVVVNINTNDGRQLCSTALQLLDKSSYARNKDWVIIPKNTELKLSIIISGALSQATVPHIHQCRLYMKIA